MSQAFGTLDWPVHAHAHPQGGGGPASSAAASAQGPEETNWLDFLSSGTGSVGGVGGVGGVSVSVTPSAPGTPALATVSATMTRKSSAPASASVSAPGSASGSAPGSGPVSKASSVTGAAVAIGSGVVGTLTPPMARASPMSAGSAVSAEDGEQRGRAAGDENQESEPNKTVSSD